ncbi:MAG: trypsin-like peptidase domain-containing protein [Clostridia bacterium]|nr:trypsin-like peptidase domain-containing protein [Clostridia bacterium]
MNRDEVKKAFLELKTREDVAELLGIKERSLRYFLFKRRPERLYTTFTITKRNGKPREISVPCREWKEIQRKLADVLSCVYAPKICAYGFIPGKSIVDNARQHTKRHLVLNIDLKDFFTQIHFGRVRGLLTSPPYGIGEEAATTIAQIACVNGVLPQGAPCSPVLTNMICVPLDNSMMKFAKATDCVYTRYADDISLSTFKRSFDPEVVYLDGEKLCIGSKLQHIFDKHSFQINPEKVAVRRNTERQEVTGLTVNVFPNLRRSYIRNLRAILDHCQRDGVHQTAKTYIEKGFCKNPSILATYKCDEARGSVEDWFISVLKGKIEYIRNVKGAESLTYLSFAQKLNEIVGVEILDISLLNRLETIAEKNTFVLECNQGESFYQGSAFYVPNIGLITSYHVVESGEFFYGYTHMDYPSKPAMVIGLSLNRVADNREIDYAIFSPPLTDLGEYALKIGDSKKLRVGNNVTIIGYPNHQIGNTPFIQNCAITSEKTFMSAPFFTVSGSIVHGASGGLVLNTGFEVVGIIKGGIQSLDDDDVSGNQGFIPIHLVLEDMAEKRKDVK